MKLYKNPIWLIFLGIITLITFWYVGTTIYRIHEYFQLNSPIGPTKITWSVKELSDDSFIPSSLYTFDLEGKTYRGTFDLENLTYKNALALEEDLPSFQKKSWIIWYNSQNPEYSSLEKKFPYKRSIYASVLFALLIYFFYIGNYVARQTGGK